MTRRAKWIVGLFLAPVGIVLAPFLFLFALFHGAAFIMSGLPWPPSDDEMIALLTERREVYEALIDKVRHSASRRAMPAII